MYTNIECQQQQAYEDERKKSSDGDEKLSIYTILLLLSVSVAKNLLLKKDMTNLLHLNYAK
jgi:hypothetical protein